MLLLLLDVLQRPFASYFLIWPDKVTSDPFSPNFLFSFLLVLNKNGLRHSRMFIWWRTKPRRAQSFFYPQRDGWRSRSGRYSLAAIDAKIEIRRMKWNSKEMGSTSVPQGADKELTGRQYPPPNNKERPTDDVKKRAAKEFNHLKKKRELDARNENWWYNVTLFKKYNHFFFTFLTFIRVCTQLRRPWLVFLGIF